MSTTASAPNDTIRCIANFLQNGPILKHFKFPRLHLPLVWGYKPEDYAEIGYKIAQGDIEVVYAEGAMQGAKAFYQLGSNCLNLTDATRPLNTPGHWSTIVHEATHMIQDHKKWKMSLAEMEADAHFAQALFLHYKGSALDSGYMPSFDSAAKNFAEGEMKEFRRKCSVMLAEVGKKYYGQSGYDDLFIKKRLDGI